jgi:membrane protease YdiL (CAAX protease family)
MQGCSLQKRKIPPLMIVKLFVKDARLRPFWRLGVYAIAVVFLSALLLAVYYAARGKTFDAARSWSDDIATELVTAIAVLIVSIFLRRTLDRRSIASLGFALRGPWLRLLGMGVLFGAGMQTIANAIEWATGSAHLTAHGSLAGDVRLVVIAAGILLAEAFLEEMSFRGYVLQNLWEEWGIVPAIVLSSVAFAWLHVINPHAHEQIALTFSGLLAFAFWASMSLLWTKSLWLALGAHMAWNLFEGPVFGLPVSGLAMPVHTVLVQSITGPVWLTGGAFGPEAGVSSLVALLAGFTVLRALYIKGAFAAASDTREAYAVGATDKQRSGAGGPTSRSSTTPP